MGNQSLLGMAVGSGSSGGNLDNASQHVLLYEISLTMATNASRPSANGTLLSASFQGIVMPGQGLHCSAGFQPILDKSLCGSAAQSLGWRDFTNTWTSISTRPRGCYVAYRDQVYFNDFPNPNHAGVAASILCQRAPQQQQQQQGPAPITSWCQSSGSGNGGHGYMGQCASKPVASCCNSNGRCTWTCQGYGTGREDWLSCSHSGVTEYSCSNGQGVGCYYSCRQDR